jgi:hypothetical protein
MCYLREKRGTYSALAYFKHTRTYMHTHTYTHTHTQTHTHTRMHLHTSNNHTFYTHTRYTTPACHTHTHTHTQPPLSPQLPVLFNNRSASASVLAPTPFDHACSYTVSVIEAPTHFGHACWHTLLGIRSSYMLLSCTLPHPSLL